MSTAPGRNSQSRASASFRAPVAFQRAGALGLVAHLYACPDTNTRNMFVGERTVTRASDLLHRSPEVDPAVRRQNARPPNLDCADRPYLSAR